MLDGDDETRLDTQLIIDVRFFKCLQPVHTLVRDNNQTSVLAAAESSISYTLE